MKKGKNRKLKSEFKKMLNEQLSSKVKESPTIVTEKDDPSEKETKKAVAKTDPYIKKDITKTIIIASTIFVLLFIGFYFLKINNSASALAEYIIGLFSL